ncbi:MAG: amino acid adenylation domain-containing protein [Desulfobulbaceae bacterium]|nr:amino acid adenylation domain-containing protein [Desulfobulbaceae bacterium]
MSHYYFWLNSRLHPDSSTYNIPAVFNISGPLDIPALEKSIATVIRRHEVFNMTFSPQGEIRPQSIANERLFHSGEIGPDEASTPDELKQSITNEITRPFNLETGPLIRVRLIHREKNNYVLVMVLHHIITDLRSKELLGAQISACYDTIIKKRKLPLLESPFLYSNYVKRRRAWESTQPAGAMLEFWKNEVQDHKGLIDLPLDHPRPPVAGSSGKAHFFQLSQEHADILNEYCCRHTIAPFIVLLTCYLLLLARYSSQKKIVVGVPLTNRRHADDKDTMGCFINILPLTLELHKDLTFSQAIHLVRRKLLQAHRNQEIAFHEIVAAAKPSREPSFNPVFQVGFTYEPPMELQLTGLSIQSKKWHNQGAQLDLFLNIFEMAPKIRGYLEYNQDLFEPETIARLSDHYQRIIGALRLQAENRLNRVMFLSEEERNKLLVQWNDTATDYGEPECIDQLFAKQAARTPDNIAVIYEQAQLTYQELNGRANQLAYYLQEQGIGAESIVGIFMERSLEMVIAIYAILKAGGAYVPLEPDLPRQRLSFILDEAKVKSVLTQNNLREKLPPFDGRTISLDADWPVIDHCSPENPPGRACPDNLAYVIYTSGSTGLPKGVMNEHRGLFNRLQWMQETFQLQPDDRVLQKTPFGFDVSVWEFFWPLIAGAILVVAPSAAHKDPVKLSRCIRQQAITTIHFVPSMLRLFADLDEASACSSLRRVFCSGEALSEELRTTFLAKFSCDFHNLYGPTEAAIDVSCWDCRQQTPGGKVPIGYPIANTQLYILDEELQPVPPGAVGELYIGGVQVARGYLQREELNKTAFIRDPFHISGNGRLYKTGDLARYLPDGAIEYLGRADFQVKLYGNRIELMEIEALLRQHPLIKDAVVIIHEEQPEKKELVAYLLGSETSLDKGELRQYLAQRIPQYMIPNHFIVQQEFPLTGSGKINRKLLPHPRQKKNSPAISSSRTMDDYVLLITSFWQKTLKTDAIDIQCNFFDAGGNSFLATQLAIDLENVLGFHIPLVKIFQYPTVSGFADYLIEKSAGPG